MSPFPEARNAVIALGGAQIARVDIVPRQPDALFPAELILTTEDGRTLVIVVEDGYRVFARDGSLVGLWK